MLHKDTTKLTVSMTKVLLARINLVLSLATLDEVRQLQVFGILVGGIWMEFVIAQTLISDLDVEGNVEVSIVFQSSMKH